MTLRLTCVSALVAVFVAAVMPVSARAQGSPVPSGQSPVVSFQLPVLVVTAQKEPAEEQSLPVSLTAVPETTLRNAGVEIVSDAGVLSPNAQFTEFTARKLSNVRFRGIGASPANPSVSTYYDGVPQLNANSASIDLLDVTQIEFVRGPQSALFGRNTLGGLINVTSTRPSLAGWTGSLSVPFANASSRDVRGSIAGPVVNDKVAIAGSMQFGRRDGYTVNDVTGNDIDSRSAFSAKGQVLWTPNRTWETRVIVTGERARDGDYALSDLGGLRLNPFHASHDYEGFTHRDIFGTTILNRREGSKVSLSSTTGFLKWKTEDSTDLDYTPLPLLRRNNAEESFQFTEEFRLASAAKAPVQLSKSVPLKWQAGVFVFTQNYDQNAVNSFSPFVLSPFVAFPVNQTSPQASLDDVGLGLYGQGTATVGSRLDLTAGVRFDTEQRDANLSTFYAPAIAPPVNVVTDKRFSDVSPQFAASYRLQPTKMVYASVARGFKAGGFNPTSPIGSEAYGEEHTWNLEGGLKTTWSGGRVTTNASVFRIDWADLQLNLPDPSVPGQFFIANVGNATSSGVEFEVNARVHSSVDVFTAVGYTHARFDEGSFSSGAAVGGNKIPNTPDYTTTIGAQLTHPLKPGISLYARGEATFYGAFKYDDFNTQGQDAYSLADFRGGARGRYLFAEAWIRNAFDTKYIPVAFAYGALAPSGFIGEMGRPRTFGVNAGVSF
ncbi:MAG TPA: TonB-dependent receptor [Vicinamibacterales bacterium]|jgi:iron complex outermembrane receptor protein